MLLALVSASLLLPTLPANDWPCFQGPNRDGTLDATGLDLDWTDGDPEVAWRVEVGAGYGGAAVFGGQVFLLDRDPGEGDVLRVLDLETGEELWSDGYEAPGRLSFAGSRTVPAVTEDLVITCGGFGQVTAWDHVKRELLWQESLEETFGGVPPMFGWSSSPLLVGDTVVLTALGEDVGLVALDAHTGEEVWVTEGVGYSHSTPVLLELLGKQQILFVSTIEQGSGNDESAPMVIWSFDPTSGATLWRHELELTRLPIPGPVKVGEDELFVTGGYRGGSTLLQVTQEGDGVALKELFHIDRGAQVHQPLVHGDHLFVLVNENWNDVRTRRGEGGLLCLGLDGEERWRTGDSPFFGRGNALLVGDHLLIQDGYNGLLRLVAATPEAFRVEGELNVFGLEGERRDHQMWGPMALADGHLLMRSQDTLACVRL